MAGMTTEQFKHEYYRCKELDTVVQIDDMECAILAKCVPDLPNYRSVRTFDLIEQLLYIERLEYHIDTYRKKYNAIVKSIDAYLESKGLKRHNPAEVRKAELERARMSGMQHMIALAGKLAGGGIYQQSSTPIKGSKPQMALTDAAKKDVSLGYVASDFDFDSLFE